MNETADGFRSGFVALAGRPNVGKSSLLNQIVDQKVSIVSDKTQTTRHSVRGVLNRDDAQVVLVDTPGVSKPRSALGKRLNDTAAAAWRGVDLVCMVVDARAGIGPGDRYLVEQLLSSGLDPNDLVVVVNKIDGQKPDRIMSQLGLASQWNAAEYFPISAFTGKGVQALAEYLVSRMEPGPRWFPADTVRDTPDPLWVAELVREQLLRVTHDEVPHSVATRVTEWEWPRVRVEILVERSSQKGIIIGKGGEVLKDVGRRVRHQLPPGAYIELVVNVASNWQHDRAAVERLGY